MVRVNDAGFGLYIHWPFCQSKCPYCDFNSHVAGRIDQGRWLQAYLAEIDRVAQDTAELRLRSVFFGGGTPSLMDPETVFAILDRVRANWPVANDWEVTLEANPGSADAARFRAFRAAGVNRLSMGVQALNDEDLKRLGRLHTLADAMAAFDIAKACYDRVSFDLIYARQDQTPDDWAQELTRALDMAVDHLSLYQLTIEDGTAFGDRHARGGLRGLPDEDRSVALYEITQELCETAGLPAYEVSNHARHGAQSQHNLIYWRGGDYAGVGPGAHGRVTLGGRRWATEALKHPWAWLDAVEKRGTGELPRDEIAPIERAQEYILMSLRLNEGLDPARLQAISGLSLPSAALTDLCALGLITADHGGVRTTPQGRMVLNAVIRRLTEDLAP
ncbi:MAG: coproporphyrinogen III oxidase [Rhodobacter sp.]|nr:coproporphyrinogen III oxidase [Rhodobacter sp.]MCA3493490.1 coproporphyrinogen III oxidase [Rhodobacter sp.]MCA3499105.1 coproporphyrinogen III oxidase [Rhodobacter sp.]MCA3502954.1 coproporphyrinogen III oxidase [Rhodobacter sp.]MCA3515576.1 coproporphyrinogen III oxidase [Rhodobacter sp.]